MSQNNDDWYEEFKVKGDELMGKVREIIEEGNARRLFIKQEDGETIFEIPLTAGVAIAVLAPVLVAVGAIAALVTKVTIGVERRAPADEDENSSSNNTEQGSDPDQPES